LAATSFGARTAVGCGTLEGVSAEAPHLPAATREPAASPPPSLSFHAELGVLGHNPWIVAAASSPLLLLLALAVDAWAGDARWLLGFAPFLLAIGAYTLLTALVRRPRPRATFVPVSASRNELRVGDRRFARDAFQGGTFLREGHRATVRLEPKNRLRTPRLDLIVAGKTEGDELLRALAFDARHAVARFRTTSAMWNHPVLAVLGIVAASLVVTQLGVDVPHVPVLLVAAFLFSWPARVDVGADGVHVRWLHTKRFYRAKDIKDARTYTVRYGKTEVVGVELVLRDGTRPTIPVATAFWEGGRAERLRTRIREIAGITHEDAGGDVALAQLARTEAEGEARAWIARLRAIGAGANATHRTAPVQPDALWRVVEDATAEPHVRVAAATALGGALDRADKDRLGRVAEATAEPKLRVALAASARDDDEALAEALDTVAPPPRATSRER
jgi:hypothetical protein